MNLNSAVASILILNNLCGFNLNKNLNTISFNNKVESSIENKINFPFFKKLNIFNNSQYNLSTKEYEWYSYRQKGAAFPEAPKETSKFLSKYPCYYLGDTSSKVLYLTFDEGYENGYTNNILDILKKHNIKAAFFVVKPYITSNPDLIKRMVNEGHLVCNHSSHHRSMASIQDKQEFNKELSEVEESFENVTGKKMPKYFRPPMGKYSELSLSYTKDYNYKTIFWSLAYDDWKINNQPSAEFAKDKILSRVHNGSIMLLHAVSKTNTQILDSVITELENQGYTFKSLDELPENPNFSPN